MKILYTIFAFFCLAGFQAHASDFNIGSRLYIDKHQLSVYQGTDKNPEIYEGENILELVPYSNGSIYFRTHLDGENGSSCMFYGIATMQAKNHYVYREGEQCKLSIAVDEDKNITLSDPGGFCTDSACGAHTSLDGDIFYFSNSHPISYIKRLKNSEEYRASSNSYENHVPIGDAFNIEWKKDHPQYDYQAPSATNRGNTPSGFGNCVPDLNANSDVRCLNWR